jgi:ankyrin repeat protein
MPFALAAAARRGHADVVALLLADGRVDPGERPPSWYTALEDAARYNRAAVVALIVADPRVGIESQGHSALFQAACGDYVDVARALLADGRLNPGQFARGTEVYNHALTAAKAGAEQIMALLLCDPRVDPAASFGPVIRAACIYRRVGIVQMLLRDGRVDPGEVKGDDCRRLEVVRLVRGAVSWRRRRAWLRAASISDC